MANSVSGLTADPTSISANGADVSVITASIIDEVGGPVEGITVNWAVSGPGKLKEVSNTTDNSGIATNSLTANDAGKVKVTASIADDSNGKSVTVTSEENVMNKVSSCVAEPVIIPSDGSVSSSITATVTEDSKAVEGVEVLWSVSGNGKIDPESSKTDAKGNAVTTLTATKSGGKAVLNISATTADDTTGKNAVVVTSTPLPAPQVLNATKEDDYTLDHYDIEFGVTAIVPFFSTATIGDRIDFNWGGIVESFEIASLDELPKIIDISEFNPEALEDGVHNVYYVVTDPAGNASISAGVSIKVVNGGETSPSLTAPSIPQADDGYINIADATKGVTVTISYADMAEGDVVTLYWVASDKNNNVITAASYTPDQPHIVASGETQFDEVIPFDYFFPAGTDGYEGTATAYYTVSPASDSGTLELSFSKLCRVDTVSP